MLRWKSSLKPAVDGGGGGGGGIPTPDILHWPLSDSSGTSISADVGPGSTASTGTLNGDYLYMDSGDTAFESSSTVAYGTNIVSVSFWWQTDNTGMFGEVFRSEIYTNTNMFEFYNSGGWKTLRVKGDSGILEERIYDLLSADTWYHFVCIFDGSTAAGSAKFYIDKVEKTLSNNSNTKTGTSNFSTAEFCMKGPYGTGGDFLMDDLRIYAGELTTAQIDAIYDAGRPTGGGGGGGGGSSPTALQTLDITFSSTDVSTFTVDSSSGQSIITTSKFNQASYSNGLRLWNGSEAGNSGATQSGVKWLFASNGDCATWWDNYWIRAKQDPNTGTYSDWIFLTDANGDIEVNAQKSYNNIGQVSNYSGPGTWTTHAASFKYQIEVYSDSNRPYLLEENFEGTGTPIGWSVTNGSADFDATPPSSSPNGGKVLKFTDRNNEVEYSINTSNALYLYFQFYVDSTGYSTTEVVTLDMGDNSHNASLYLTGSSSSNLFLRSRYNNEDATVNNYQEDTWYHCWMYFNPATGEQNLEFNTTGTQSGSGDGFVTRTVATNSSSISKLKIEGRRSANTYIDRIILSEEYIGSNP